MLKKVTSPFFIEFLSRSTEKFAGQPFCAVFRKVSGSD